MALTLPWFFRKETRIYIQQSELPQRVSGARTRGGCGGCSGPGSQERSLGDSAGTTPLPRSGSLLLLCLFRLQPLDSGLPVPSDPLTHAFLHVISPLTSGPALTLQSHTSSQGLLQGLFFPTPTQPSSQTVPSSTHRRK